MVVPSRRGVLIDQGLVPSALVNVNFYHKQLADAPGGGAPPGRDEHCLQAGLCLPCSLQRPSDPGVPASPPASFCAPQLPCLPTFSWGSSSHPTTTKSHPQDVVGHGLESFV